MDAKGRKVLNGLTKLGGEQEVFDVSITVKMTEDAVQAILMSLGDEGVVSCRRDEGGKEFWSLAAESGAGEATGRKKGKATAAGPDDRFDEFIVDSKVASPEPAPAPIRPTPPETASFEAVAPPHTAKPANVTPAIEDDFEPKPSKREKRTKDDDFEPKVEKVKPAKQPKKKTDDDTFETKTVKEGRAERELAAGPDDHFDEFAERVPSKPNLPIPLMAGAAILILIVILFIVGGGGGKTKKIKAEVDGVRTELTARLDSLEASTTAEIKKLWIENKKLRDEVSGLKKTAGGTDAQKKAADATKSTKNPKKKGN